MVTSAERAGADRVGQRDGSSGGSATDGTRVRSVSSGRPLATVCARVCAMALLVGGLAGCAAMPSTGPTAAAIVHAAQPHDPQRPFELIDLDAARITTLARFRPPRLSARFPDRRPSPVQTIGVGDAIQVTIFEAGTGGLFTASAGQLGGGSKNVTLPTQAVEADGTIGIPFAGRIRAAGRTPAQVAQAIEGALTGRALDPQAVVSIQQGRSGLVTVTGQVGAANRVPLSPQGDRLLDVLANAGGPSGNPNELFVQLTRGPSTAVSPLRAIIEAPTENVFVWPNDTIFVYREPQVFTAFGATGQSGNFPFEYERMTLAEAIGAASGLNDQRADPAGVFVYRLERRDAVCALLAYAPCEIPGELVPVVYRLDLRDPEGLFHARQMLVRNKDIVYVANSEVAELRKFLSLVGTVMSGVRSGAALVD